jgi:hypothetical protein
MGWPGRHAAGGQPEGSLPRRPPGGAEQARAHLAYRGAHRALGAGVPGSVTDPTLLRRVRDALASGRRP